MGKRCGSGEGYIVRKGAHPLAGGSQRCSKAVRGTRADAWKELRKVQAAQDEGRYVDPSRITLDAFLDRWLETMKPTWRTATYDQAERLLRS